MVIAEVHKGEEPGVLPTHGEHAGSASAPEPVPASQQSAPQHAAPQQSMSYGTPPAAAHQTAHAAPRTPVVNPFAGIPIGDYGRDAAAVILLFTSLALPWDMQENTGGRWWAALAVLISVASLSLPYLGKARVIPGWGPRHVRLAKLAAFVPMGVSALSALINELVHVSDPFDGGLGTGLAVALAGALLALQPRAAEEDTRGQSADALWWAATRATAVAVVLVSVATWLAFLLEDVVDGGYIFDDVFLVAQYVLALVGGLIMLAVPAVVLLSGGAHGRRVAAVIGLSVPPLAIFWSDDRDGLVALTTVEKWNTPLGGVFLLASLGALAVSRPAQRRTRPTDPVGSWISTARLAMAVAAGGLAVAGARQAMIMLAWEDFAADRIVPIILTSAGALALLVGRSMLSTLPGTRAVVLVLLVAVSILGIITLAVSDEMTRSVDLPAASAWFALPGLAAYALLAPSAVRNAFGPLLPDLAEPQSADGGPPPRSV